MRAMSRKAAPCSPCFALCAVPAQAQLGGLIKKAAKKAAESKIEDKVESVTPVKPPRGRSGHRGHARRTAPGLLLELETKDKTKQLLTAIEAKARELAEAERAAGNEPDVWRTANRDVERCVSNSLDKSNERHAAEMPQKMMALTSPGKDNTAPDRRAGVAGQADVRCAGQGRLARLPEGLRTTRSCSASTWPWIPRSRSPRAGSSLRSRRP